MPGFTGEVWQRHPAEKLARDIMNGVGPKALFESGLTWLSIETELNELTADVAHIIKSVDEGWHGSGGDGMVGALRKLHAWLVETADMAHHNAKAAEVQAVATTVARTTMPQAAEVESLTELHDSMKAMDFPAGSMLGGGMAFVESSLKTVKANAARVMETYEQATTPVAQPWEPVVAPVKLVKVVTVKRPEALGGTGAASGAVGLPAGALAALGAMMAPTARTVDTSEHNARKTTVKGADKAAVEGESVTQTEVAHMTEVDESTTTHAPMAGPVGASSAAAGSAQTVSQLNLTSVDEGDSAVAVGEQTAAPAVFGATEEAST
ncbi:PPE domain-containing protein [Gordonia crocea]|uniref:PPE domain-containing protein n=1 Tax=Gordonia crocea TaxID=589162 RepID=A0A7I9UYM2_9ACTN|nr:PPE domain-containing protein [Gordonia crocea]GED98009.1 hypothetical protein nbrc107697_20480 [Gordonia crocea]